MAPTHRSTHTKPGSANEVAIGTALESKKLSQALVRDVSALVDHLPLRISEAIEPILRSQLSAVGDQIRAGYCDQALSILEKLRSDHWPSYTGPTRRQILHLIGAAYFHRGDEVAAARYFIEAHQHEPDAIESVFHRAVGHVLLGEPEVGVAFANELVGRNPASSLGWSAIAMTSPESEPVSELERRIPRHVRHSAEVQYGLALAAARKGEPELARLYCEETIRIAPDSTNAKSMLAALLFDELGLRVDLRSLAYRKWDTAALAKLSSLFEELWDGVRLTSLAPRRLSWLEAHAIVREAVGDSSRAIELIDEALVVDPSDGRLRTLRASMSLAGGDVTGALRALARLSPEQETFHSASLAVMGHASHGDYAKAREVVALARHKPFGVSRQDRLDLLDSEIMRLEVGPGAALDWIRQQLAERPESLELVMASIRLARLLGDNNYAYSQVLIALDLLKKSEGGELSRDLARECALLGDSETALLLWESFVDPSVLDDEIRNYLVALVKEGRWKRALELARAVEAIHGPDRMVIAVQMRVLEIIGDYAGARNAAARWLADTPEDSDMRRDDALLAMRMGALEEVRVYLDSAPPFSIDDATSAFQLAVLYGSNGRFAEGVRIAYEIRRRHSSNPSIQAQYIKFVSMFGASRRALQSINAFTPIVLEDTSVDLEDLSGGTRTVTIESRDDPNAVAIELSLDHPLSQSLLGRAVGDVVSSPVGSTGGAFVIRSIRSKFVSASHASFGFFDTQSIPSDAGLHIGRVEELAGW